MADLIDRQAVREIACAGCTMHGDYGECYNPEPCERLLAAFVQADEVDAVEVDFIAKWLFEIALNNCGYPVEDMAAACVEIIKRLDGLRKFAEERREENAEC